MWEARKQTTIKASSVEPTRKIWRFKFQFRFLNNYEIQNGFCIKDSITYIHFIKGCWYQIGIFLANTLVECILQACIYQENMEKCEKYKADGYAGRRQNYFRRLESKTIYTYDWCEGKQLILFPENLETKLNVSLGTSL